MTILIYGAGAIGSTFGGFLSRDHDVTLLGRKRHLEAIRRRGLRVAGIWGRHVFRRFRFETDFKKIIKEKMTFDLILVTVKSFGTENAAKAIRKILTPQTRVVSLQNGLGNVEALERHLPKNQILAGRVIFGVEVPKPGAVKITVMADPTAVGEIAVKKITPRVRKIAALFSGAGVPAYAFPDVESKLWSKVIYNSALNPLASLLEVHYGELMEHAQTRAVMDEVIAEIYEVAHRAKICLTPPTPAVYRKLFYAQMVPRTYDHHPSMLQDLQKGKRTEIDSLNGAVVKLGKRYRIPVPVNRMLAGLIRKKERLCLR